LTVREAFERAILDSPDDIAGYAAYADWLQEHDDPRGEFVAVQLALEDPSRAKAQRERLKQREKELLREHEGDWLGELAPHLLDREGSANRPRVRYWWARGFLAELRVQYPTTPLVEALASAPAARLLRKLHIESFASDLSRQLRTPTRPEAPSLPGLSQQEADFARVGGSWMENLRVLQVGEDDEPSSDGWTECNVYAVELVEIVARLPRVEELYLLCNGYDARTLFGLPNLTHLQVLRVYGLGEEDLPELSEVPLDALARNPALGALTHLTVHPHYSRDHSFLPLEQVRALVNSPHLKNLSHLQLRLAEIGDEGTRAIVESGILKRLGWLDLRNGTITDYGAKAFADCEAAKNLRRLDLSRNLVTHAGLNLLRRAGVNAVADNALSRRESEARDREERDEDAAEERNRRNGDWE
jgi:uncharacterized protein (TIGR02996 family)